MPITIKNILIAIVAALIWVLLVMFATFSNEFESMQFGLCSLGTMGKTILLTMVIYLFDILLMEIILTSSSSKTIKGYYVVCLVFVMLNLFILYLVAIFPSKVSSIYPILFLGVSMGSIKAKCVFQAIVKSGNSNDNIMINRI